MPIEVRINMTGSNQQTCDLSLCPIPCCSPPHTTHPPPRDNDPWLLLLVHRPPKGPELNLCTIEPRVRSPTRRLQRKILRKHPEYEFALAGRLVSRAVQRALQEPIEARDDGATPLALPSPAKRASAEGKRPRERRREGLVDEQSEDSTDLSDGESSATHPRAPGGVCPILQAELELAGSGAGKQTAIARPPPPSGQCPTRVLTDSLREGDVLYGAPTALSRRAFFARGAPSTASVEDGATTATASAEEEALSWQDLVDTLNYEIGVVYKIIDTGGAKSDREYHTVWRAQRDSPRERAVYRVVIENYGSLSFDLVHMLGNLPLPTLPGAVETLPGAAETASAASRIPELIAAVESSAILETVPQPDFSFFDVADLLRHTLSRAGGKAERQRKKPTLLLPNIEATTPRAMPKRKDAAAAAPTTPGKRLERKGLRKHPLVVAAPTTKRPRALPVTSQKALPVRKVQPGNVGATNKSKRKARLVDEKDSDDSDSPDEVEAPRPPLKWWNERDPLRRTLMVRAFSHGHTHTLILSVHTLTLSFERWPIIVLAELTVFAPYLWWCRLRACVRALSAVLASPEAGCVTGSAL